jgi:hypothetical protein
MNPINHPLSAEPKQPAPPKNSRSEQSRINGSKSRGPITANALKHGFAAKLNVLIAPDDSDAWTAHIAGYHASYHPTNYAETEFVDQLASISWRKSRLVGIETALIDFQLSVQEERMNAHFPDEQDNAYLHLAFAWQSLARSPPPTIQPSPPPTQPSLPDGLDINTLLNFRQYRKDFATAPASAERQAEPAPATNPIEPTQPSKPNEPKPHLASTPPSIEIAPKPNEPKNTSPPKFPETKAA